MKIYTRQGDDGSTALYGGPRVSKASSRVEAYGLVDEVNAVLGWVRVVAVPEKIDAFLLEAQGACFRLGAHLAAAPGKDPGVPAVGAADVEALEALIDALDERLPPLRSFILPGGSESAARLHVARTVVRRAERQVTACAQTEDVGTHAVAWLNRLSDVLFTAARAANATDGVLETPWPPK